MNSESGVWSETTVAGHPVDVFRPARPSEHGYVVMFLHGVHLGRLNNNDVYTRLFDEFGFSVVAPITQRSWWTDRICREFDPTLTAERHVLDNVLPFIQEQFGAQPPQIGLLGASMGGQGALRLAFKHPRLFPVVAAVSPAIDYHLRLREDDETLSEMYANEEEARQDTATLHVHPLNWPRHLWFCCDPEDARWFEGADRLQMKLSSIGIMHECDLETSAGGHSWDYYNHMAPQAVGHLNAALEQERLRV